MDSLIDIELDELNDIYDNTVLIWDKRVHNYSREYYSKLITNKVKTNIFDSETIRNKLFDIIKRLYTIDQYVFNQISTNFNFKNSLINAINFRNILNVNAIDENLAFNLEIEKEILKNYEIFEKNMLDYMESQFYELCLLLFRERSTLKFKLFKGKNSEFIAETLNKSFNSYILDKGGALL